ncbi:unnamed protein product [Cylicostephanus goldi]|uniref:Uncharacterized protein n=1 Tax=Cylicostephanus goldi TaxID=71465 RepID=A0A3P6SU78_CYLGO|nr:unnamed protein product [Cylicostephanus goldi]
MFALEHRFYGESRPTIDQSVENLRYLSSRQALEDLSAFVKAMNEEHHLENPRWVTFGGSYPGNVCLSSSCEVDCQKSIMHSAKKQQQAGIIDSKIALSSC